MEKNIRLVEMGKRIRILRLEKELSQEALAHMCGYNSRSSINKIEAGLNDIPQSKIKAIADALSVSPAWLMSGEKENAETGGASAPAIDLDEAAVLSQYRRLSPEGRQYIHDQLHFRLGIEYEQNKKETRHA